MQKYNFLMTCNLSSRQFGCEKKNNYSWGGLESTLYRFAKDILRMSIIIHSRLLVNGQAVQYFTEIIHSVET